MSRSLDDGREAVQTSRDGDYNSILQHYTARDNLDDNSAHVHANALHVKSFTLGPVYREVLENKRREYEHLLKDSKSQLKLDNCCKSMW